MNRRHLLITYLISLLLPALVYSASVYETQADFLSRAFNGSPPEPAIVWLSGERKSTVRQILGHDYAALRLRYWCEGERSAWILEEIGKDLPITVGIIIENDYIKNLRVLTYRENRGGEVATASFTDQFNNAVIEEGSRLDVKIDGISGATLSVQALTRLATMALFLNTQSSCKNGA
ncbi:MAG: FMN-binding protein [Lysobacterales bacterium]